MKIHTYMIPKGKGGLYNFLSGNALCKILKEDIYENVNDMIIKNKDTLSITDFLNSQSEDMWEVLFIRAQHSEADHRYLFIRVIKEVEVV